MKSVLQLIPGHEIVGIISQLGRAVVGFSIGERCVADNTILVSQFHPTHTNGVFNDLLSSTQCSSCFFCRRGQYVLCENFDSLGVTMAGGFAEYVAM